MTSPIGIFDSGIGGLTVAKEVIKLLPAEDVVYFGDTARVPYGVKSRETIIKFSLENTLFLLEKNVKIIVIACNTSSSLALCVMRKHFKVPIIGVIEPGAREAVSLTRTKRIGVIGTRATIDSGSYEQEIEQLDPGIKIFTQACPMFVPLVEEGWMEERVTEEVIEKYLAPLKKKRIDTLILGCTHYPLLKKQIRRIMGEQVVLIDSARQAALGVKELLVQHRLLTRRRRQGHREYFVSDEVAVFKSIAQRILGRELKKIKKVNYV